jgi:hypothetical protein
LYAVTEFCRTNQLLTLPRALQNLAWAVREEGDWIRSAALLSADSGDRPAGHTLATGYSGEAMHAYFDGEFGKLLAAADAFVDTPTGRWDMHVRGLRACLRVLRGQPVPGGAVPPDDVTDALDTARRSGFHRLHWTMLGLGALCRALQGHPDEAATLLDELIESWCAVPALASGEWIAAAGYAAALAGRDSAVRVREMLERVGHRTPWTDAAMCTVTAALAGADGNHAQAGQHLIAAAGIYARIPDATDRVLALALAAVELDLAGDRAAAQVALAEVRAFALRNQAPGLLLLGEGRGSEDDWSPVLAC